MRTPTDPGPRRTGHGACVATCPDVFALTGDGYAEEILGEFAELVERSASHCPERAIGVHGPFPDQSVYHDALTRTLKEGGLI